VRYKLHSITEQRVLKAGLLKLQKVLAGRFSLEQLSELPRRRDGGQLFMTPSFYQRLLRNELELKTLLDGDVSAAQSDVRHLRLEQLLTIRTGCLDWATECEMKSAHINFLHSVDVHLFERLASELLQWSLDPPPQSAALHALGLRLALTIGAVEVIAGGWGGPSFPDQLPDLWALGLNAEDWSGCSAAAFDTKQLSVELIGGQGTTFEEVMAGRKIVVATDRSSGVGKDRMLRWEIAVLDPTENVLLEINRTDDAEVGKKKMSAELSDVLKKRMSGRSEVLGLPNDAKTSVESNCEPELPAATSQPARLVRQPKVLPTPEADLPVDQARQTTPERRRLPTPGATPPPPAKPEKVENPKVETNSKVELADQVKNTKEASLDKAKLTEKEQAPSQKAKHERKATFLGTVLPDCITDVLECGGNRRD